MRATVVYESMFGNTRAVAEAISEGIRQAAPGATVECWRTGEPGRTGAGADLLVVGAPTHFLGMPSPRSRRMRQQVAEHDTRPISGERGPQPPGVREWLQSLPMASSGQRAAAFDTRLGKLMAGSAARQIARSLRRHGYELTDRPQGFVVADFTGPLAAGELDRARAWGKALAAQLTPVPA
jgi:hypothetical protein